MAREYMERQAYMEIENAARSCPQFDQQIVSMSQTQVHSPSPEALPPNATMLPGTSLSHVDGCSGLMKRSASAPGNSANGMVAAQTDNESTYQDRQNNNNDKYNMINAVRKKLSNNFEHYSNMLQEMALPVLLGRKKGNNIRSREASRDRVREAEKPKGHSMVSDSTHSDEDDFEFVENIELHHLDGFIFSSGREQGKGHDFHMIQLKAPTWCDKCGDFIWGVYKQCLVCKNCQYTCHHKCRQQVALDCANVAAEGKNTERPSRHHSETSLGGTQSQADDADSGYHTANSTLLSKNAQANKAQTKVIAPSLGTLTREDLRRRIEAFNNNSHGLIMTLDSTSSTFQGFIRVHMNLIRPINMSLAVRPPSIYEVMTHEEPSGQTEETEESEIASFYLPKDTTKVIHINSDTTAQEVIRALLTKFRITDNPRKFALYEKIEQAGVKATMRRLGDIETPLHLCLGWTAGGLAHKKFVLQENEPGEIMWEAFSMPELENFLKILDREEAEYVEQIKAKYILLRIQLERRRKELGKDREEKKEPQQSKREPVYV